MSVGPLMIHSSIKPRSYVRRYEMQIQAGESMSKNFAPRIYAMTVAFACLIDEN